MTRMDWDRLRRLTRPRDPGPDPYPYLTSPGNARPEPLRTRKNPIEKLRDEFSRLAWAERVDRKDEFRTRLNQLSLSGDIVATWNLRFEPLLRAPSQALKSETRASRTTLSDAGVTSARTRLDEPNVGVPSESGFEIIQGDQIDIRIRKTPSGRTQVRATGYRYLVQHHGGHQLEARLFWTADERWVEAREIVSGSSRLHRLDGSLRLVIDTRSAVSFCSLRQARVSQDGSVTLHSASLHQLTEGAGVPIIRELKRVGAYEFGTRAVVMGDTGRARNLLCVTFDDANEAVPILAFVLTRVAPLIQD